MKSWVAKKNLVPLLAVVLVVGCRLPAPEEAMTMEMVAESFVKLSLALGQHDSDYVDAYFGPELWKDQIASRVTTLEQIRAGAEAELIRLGEIEVPRDDELAALRYHSLKKSLQALIARADLLAGVEMTFDEESAALYDAVAPQYPAEHFDAIVGRLDDLLPGDGPLVDRYQAFRAQFAIPADKLDAVFGAAIEACRARTREYIELPENESFEVEYVTDKSWSGYNWYKGGYHSLIQVNTDLPIFVDRAVDLACHEGYPGHHVYNVLLERELVKSRQWDEYLIYPLFSPRSLIAEGTANFGIEVAFPGEERTRFEREVLFPLAGLDVGRVDDFYEVQELVAQLSYAGNEAARGYLDGDMSEAQAIDWLARYSLMSPERAAQRLRFIEQYRSYVINYNLGKDMVRGYIERRGGTADNAEKRWQEFTRLLSEPHLPSEMQAVDRDEP